MTWKLTLGRPGNTYIIGKRWVKKNISKSKRLHKNSFKNICSDYIYNIGFHYLPNDPTKIQELWVCMKTGELFEKNKIIKVLKTSRSSHPINE